MGLKRLLDVVSVYNKVTDLMDRKQAVRIIIDKVQAFRVLPLKQRNETTTILECVCMKDKFILHENTKASSRTTLGLVSEVMCRNGLMTIVD